MLHNNKDEGWRKKEQGGGCTLPRLTWLCAAQSFTILCCLLLGAANMAARLRRACSLRVAGSKQKANAIFNTNTNLWHPFASCCCYKNSSAEIKCKKAAAKAKEQKKRCSKVQNMNVNIKKVSRRKTNELFSHLLSLFHTLSRPLSLSLASLAPPWRAALRGVCNLISVWNWALA